MPDPYLDFLVVTENCSENLKLLKNGATHLRDNGDVRFYLSARAL